MTRLTSFVGCFALVGLVITSATAAATGGGGTGLVTHYTIQHGGTPGRFGPASFLGTFVLGDEAFAGEMTTGTAAVYNDDPEGFSPTTIEPFVINGESSRGTLTGTCEQRAHDVGRSPFYFRFTCEASIDSRPGRAFVLQMIAIGAPYRRQIGPFVVSEP